MPKTLATLAATLAIPLSALAQPAAPDWSPDFGTEGLSGTVNAACSFDPDGAGPLPPVLIVGGQFSTVGSQSINNIAQWDGTQWSSLADGLVGTLYCLGVFDFDGPGPNPPRLFAGGSFGPGASSAIEVWDGQSWSPPPVFLNGYGYSFATMDDDGSGPNPPSLFVGGFFAGPSCSVVRWTGAGWTNLGAQFNGYALALAAADFDGPGPNPPSLFAGGFFTSTGVSSASRLARWDGAQWSPVGAGVDDDVRALAAIDPDNSGHDSLYIGGDFDTAGGNPAAGIARYTGTTFEPMGPGVNGRVHSIFQADDDGHGPHPPSIIAAGAFSTGVARFDGAAWQAMGQGFNATVNAGCVWNDGVNGPRPVVVGDFTNASWSVPNPVINIPRVAQWDGATWSPVGPAGLRGLNNFASALAVYDDDGPGPRPPALYLGGRFTFAGGLPINRLARFDGHEFTPVSSGTNNSITALAAFDDDGPGPHGEALYVAGLFSTAGGVSAFKVASWNGSVFSSLNFGFSSGDLNTMVPFDEDGSGPNPPRLFLAGSFSSAGGQPAGNIARWDGAAWSSLSSGTSGTINALAVFDPDGSGPLPDSLYAAGTFSSAGGQPASSIARWNGTAWSALGAGIQGTVRALAVFDDDGPGPHPAYLYAGGSFNSAGGASAFNLARWNGIAWSGVNTLGAVEALTVFDPDGDGPDLSMLYATGQSFQVFTATGIANIASWNGTAWSALGTGLRNGGDEFASYDHDGHGPHPPALFVAGRFSAAGGVSSEYIARWGCTPSMCYANCDNSTIAPILNVSDFICFMNRYAANDPYANCDNSSIPPTLNIADFICFMNRFAAGCP